MNNEKLPQVLFNMGFCASRAWRSNFGCLHRCTLVRAWRNSVGLLVVILYFYFFIGLQFRAGQSTMPCLHKALFVSWNWMKTKKKGSGLFVWKSKIWKDFKAEWAKLWSGKEFSKWRICPIGIDLKEILIFIRMRFDIYYNGFHNFFKP